MLQRIRRRAEQVREFGRIVKEPIGALGGLAGFGAAGVAAIAAASLEDMNGPYQQLTDTLNLALTPAAVVVSVTAAAMVLLAQIREDPSDELAKRNKIYVPTRMTQHSEANEESLEELPNRDKLLISSWLYFMLGVSAMLFILLRATFSQTSAAPTLGLFAIFFLVMIFSGLANFGITSFKFVADLRRVQRGRVGGNSSVV